MLKNSSDEIIVKSGGSGGGVLNTSKRVKRGCLRWIWLSLLIITIDQITKYWMTSSLIPYQPKPVLPFFNFTLMENHGAAFSFLSHYGILASWLFAAVACVISFILILWMSRLAANKHWLACALALILGGAIGNLIDRIVHGYVIDFLDFYFRQWHFAAFNIADASICVGAFMLLIDAIFYKKLNP